MPYHYSVDKPSLIFPAPPVVVGAQGSLHYLLLDKSMDLYTTATVPSAVAEDLYPHDPEWRTRHEKLMHELNTLMGIRVSYPKKSRLSSGIDMA